MNEPTIISKTVTVMKWLMGEGDEVTFVREDSEPNRVRRIEVPRAQWEEMGKPEMITMTLEPGDHLNAEEVL